MLRHVLSGADQVLETEVLDGNDAALSLYLGEDFVLVETKQGRLVGNEKFAATGHLLRWSPSSSRGPSE